MYGTKYKMAATKSSVASSSSATGSGSYIYEQAIWGALVLYAAYIALKMAYQIRMGAIELFGPVIHEFDPYFNYRATEVRHGRNYTKRRKGTRNCCAGSRLCVKNGTLLTLFLSAFESHSFLIRTLPLSISFAAMLCR